MDQETVDKIKTYHRIELEVREALRLVVSDSADYTEFNGWLASIRKKQEFLQLAITP